MQYDAMFQQLLISA